MYTSAKPTVAAVVAGAAVVTTLPNTGSSLMVSAALSVAAGMIAWGVVYARTR